MEEKKESNNAGVPRRSSIKPNMIQISLYIDRELNEKLRQTAVKCNTSKAVLIEAVLVDYLKKLNAESIPDLSILESQPNPKSSLKDMIQECISKLDTLQNTVNKQTNSMNAQYSELLNRL